jgi:membrane protease YdiL (CAAX protease family)
MAYQDDHEVYEVVPTQEYRRTDADDKKWFGVPAPGTKPTLSKFSWIIIVLFVIIIEICIWAVYRWATAPIFVHFGTYEFYLFHIIFAPTIHLGPIFLFWWFIWHEPSYFEMRRRGENFFMAVKKSFPFAITKKLLLSGMIIGFIAAIIWRLLEEFLFIGLAGASGATVPGTLTFLNVIETADMVIIMTFLMYFIVGPVEEIEFRGFLQDQVGRVTYWWIAIILSSILFGCSHIPIALFIYKLEGTYFVAALYSWIAAGFTFGFLYYYSRQLFACIVMHGMGNWQLSIYYFMSQPSGVDPYTAMYIDIAVATLANGLMIVFFYIINEYYWQPHRRGEPAFGGAFLRLQTFIHDHDYGKRSLTQTFAVAIAFMFVVSAIIMGVTAGFGSRELVSPPPDTGSGGSVNLDDMVDTPEQITGSESLNEGATSTLTYDSEPGTKYIKSVSVTLTWTDEADRNLRYTNQPDTFSITISGLNGTNPVTAEASNPTGGTGSVSADYSLSLDDIQDAIDNEIDNITVTVDITMVEAGNQEKTSGLPGLAWTDSGNQYSYTIDIVWLTTPEE